MNPAAMNEFTQAIQNSQAEGESHKMHAFQVAQENMAKLAAKDEIISANQVRRRGRARDGVSNADVREKYKPRSHVDGARLVSAAA